MSSISAPNDIVARLDSLISDEESEIRKLEGAASKRVTKNSLILKSADPLGDWEINLQIIKPRGTRKQVIKPGFSYASFLELVQSTLGKDQEMIGFRHNSQGSVVYIKSNQDVRFMEDAYFASGQEILQVVAIEKEKSAHFRRFNFKKEIRYGRGCAAFMCEIGGPEFPLVFVAVRGDMDMSAGVGYLESVFGRIESLRYKDRDDDIVTVDSDDSWEYCLADALASSEQGMFRRLLIETSAAGSD